MNRNDFPLLKDFVYLDSAASGLKPKSVIKKISEFYLKYPLNPHSVDSAIGMMVLKKVQETRNFVKTLIGGKDAKVIFNSGTTDGLNKIAKMLCEYIPTNKHIILSKTNHASAIVPFIESARDKKLKIKISENILKDINKNTGVLVIAQEPNSIGYKEKWQDIIKKARANNTIIVNDAAQAIAHQKVRFSQVDVVLFSGNKLYGPTGIGVMAIRDSLLKKLKPSTYGGGATSKINEKLDWDGKGNITDFEAGTPNTAGIIGLGEAIKYFNTCVSKGLFEYEKTLSKYAFDALRSLPNIEIYSKKGDTHVLFNVEDNNAQDVVSSLGHHNIILRAGSHCAHLANKIMNVNSSIRLSIGLYNTKKDINQLIKALKGGNFLDFI